MAEDLFAGLMRVAKLNQGVDERAGAIITYLAALEFEVDLLLGRFLRRQNCLKGLSFGQKVSVLAAAWPHDPATGDALCHCLIRFYELRNKVAHVEDKTAVSGAVGRLNKAIHALLPDFDGEELEPGNAAMLLMGFMQDGSAATVGTPLKVGKPD